MLPSLMTGVGSLDPSGGGRKPIPTNCPLIPQASYSTWAPTRSCAHAYTHPRTQSFKKFIIFFFSPRQGVIELLLAMKYVTQASLKLLQFLPQSPECLRDRSCSAPGFGPACFSLLLPLTASLVLQSFKSREPGRQWLGPCWAGR